MKRKRIIRTELDASQSPALSPEEEARQTAMTAAGIEEAAASDPDNPPLTERELERAVLARRLKRLRTRLDLSQTAFARRYGIPVANLRQYEIGRVLPPPAVRAYLKVIEAEPERTAKALGEVA